MSEQQAQSEKFDFEHIKACAPGMGYRDSKETLQVMVTQYEHLKSQLNEAVAVIREIQKTCDHHELFDHEKLNSIIGDVTDFLAKHKEAERWREITRIRKLRSR